MNEHEHEHDSTASSPGLVIQHSALSIQHSLRFSGDDMATTKKRRFTKFELVGLAAVILIAVVYLYEYRVSKPLNARKARAEKALADLDAAMKPLKQTPPNSAILKSLKNSQAEWTQANARLAEAQKCLADPDEVSVILAKVMENAAHYKLTISVTADGAAGDIRPRVSETRRELRKAPQKEAEAGRRPSAFSPRPSAAKSQFAIPDRSYHRIELRGSFKNVRDFLDSLGKLQKRVWADNLAISLREEDRELQVKMRLGI